MKDYKEKLDELADEVLKDPTKRPCFSNMEFMSCVIIFFQGLMDKMYDLQDSEGLDPEQCTKMGNRCAEDLRKLIHTYTGLDTLKTEDFLK